MKIAIDASRAVNETAGIGRYCREIVKNLLQIDQKNQYLLIFTYFRKDPRKVRLIKEFEAPNVKIKTLRIPGGLKEKIWGWKIPYFGGFLENADVFFAPSFFEVNFGLKIPQVVAIHDLTTFIFPLHRGKEVSGRLSKRAFEAGRLAKKIIVISQSAAVDAEKYLKVSKNKIKMIYSGLSYLPKPAQNLPGLLKPKSYILFVGTIEPRKNLTSLFKAYALLPPRLQNDFPLVVVGAKGWNTGETYDCLRALKLEGKVKFLGFVSDAILAKLYQEAAVFCYPSVYEGFGLPILEALGFGTPVVTSNISSLPEVAGKAAILVDPHNPKSICQGIQQALENQNKIEELKKEAQKQIKKFSWEKAAKETLKLLEEVAGD